MSASRNRDHGISILETILIVILIVIILMIVWALLGPSVQEWYAGFWSQISTPNP